MKRFAFLALAIFSCLSIANAQDGKKPEFFGGYSYESLNSGITSNDLLSSGVTQTSLENRFNLNGFNFAGTGYFTKRFGVTVDFSGHFRNRTDFFDTTTANSKLSLYNFTAGPHYRFTNTTRFTPFVHALFGFAHRNLREENAAGTIQLEDSGNSFSMNLGGGLDYGLNKRFALRIFQIDYNPIFLRSRTVDTIAFPDRTLNGARISVGLVLK